MTVDQMESLRTALSEFLGEFADCFGRCEPRLKLSKYVRGQLTGASALRLMNAFQHEWRRAKKRRVEMAGASSLRHLNPPSPKDTWIRLVESTPGRDWSLELCDGFVVSTSIARGLLARQLAFHVVVKILGRSRRAEQTRL